MPPQLIEQDSRHYLEVELEELVQNGGVVWEFLRKGSLDGVWYWDLENPDQEWMSPELWRLFGIDPETKAHCPDEWQDLINPDDLKTALENFNAHCADPDHPYDQIVRYRHADGSTVWVRCRGLAIRDETGRPIRMLGAHNDMTPVKVAEQEMRAQRAEAQQSIADLTAFAYALSHEMKSPSNTMKMLITEARRSLGEGDVTDAANLMEMADTTVDSMRMLVEDLLNYTRTVGDPTEIETVDLEDVASRVLDLLAAELKETGAVVTLGELGCVQGSSWQLQQLLRNLVSNANKYSAPGTAPEIGISTRDGADSTKVIEVSDKGIGIPEDQQEQMFEMFRRVHRSGSYDGTGLGLALCAQIARNHGTHIEVASKPGKGSVFSIALQSGEFTQ